MAKTIWIRCPKCNSWCSAEKKDFDERFIDSILTDEKKAEDFCGNLADKIGMKGIGMAGGRVLNMLNPIGPYKHIGEMLYGDNYKFKCECGWNWGTDDESKDKSEEHDLWFSAFQYRDNFKKIINASQQETELYIREVEETLAQVENCSYIKDAGVVLHDILACLYFYVEKNSQKALLEIDKSLELKDDPHSHVLKGLFYGNVSTPVENYNKMNELLKIKECDNPNPYVEKALILNELNIAEKKYGGNFAAIPENQRKFLVMTSEYTYLPESFKVLKFDDNKCGIKFEGGSPLKNAIYVAHPYKPNVYLPSESYQKYLLEDQLNELRELLQGLGAKSVAIDVSDSREKSDVGSSGQNIKVGGKFKGIGGDGSVTNQAYKDVMDSMVKTMLVSDDFSFIPEQYPFVPAELVWYEHMEEWQRLKRMRERGQLSYCLTITDDRINIVNQNEANQVNAEFNALIANGNFEYSKSSEIKAYEKSAQGIKIKVEFYPLSDYRLTPTKEINNLPINQNTQNIQNRNIKLFIGVIVGLLAIIAVLLYLILK